MIKPINLYAPVIKASPEPTVSADAHADLANADNRSTLGGSVADWEGVRYEDWGNSEVQNIDARSDDFSVQYLATRRDANAPSSAAWKGAINAGMDPGDVVLDRPFFDAIETRTDGKNIFKVGVDNDNPENSVVLSVLEGGEGDGTPVNGEGDDPLEGGEGDDTLEGGEGEGDDNNVVSSVLEVLGDVGTGLAKGVLMGARDAGKELGDTFTGGFWSSTIVPWMRENIPGLAELDAAGQQVKPEGGVQKAVAGFAAPMAQVIMPGALFTKAFRVAGYGRILAETLGYSAAEVVAIAPKDMTLMELGLQLIDDDPDMQSAIEKAFAAQESESDFMTRIKNMPRRVLEGGGIGIVTERMFQAVGMAYRFMKNSPAYKRAAGRMAEGKSPVPVGMSIEDVGRPTMRETLAGAGKKLNEDEILTLINDVGTNILETSINKTGVSAVRVVDRFGTQKKERKTFKAGATEQEVRDWLGGVEPASTLTQTGILERVATTVAERDFGKAFMQKFNAQFNPKTGFMKAKLVGGAFTTSKTGKIVFKPKFQQPAYAFHIPPGKLSKEKWAERLASRTVDRVTDIVARAQGGDQAAKDIISEARWYRAMRVRLRREFGGIGDVFADTLGATSAQTGVKTNWENSIEIMRRFSRGEFDEELAAFAARSDEGLPMGSSTLHQLDKVGEFPLIRSAAGSLFNANSPAATGALLGLFRTIKEGRSPKTPNFTGNLIGYSNDATIDVWAARFLRNIAGKPYIPPGAEKAVGGKHLAGSTQADPKIGGEFGFGQDVFAQAAEKINNSGLIKNYDVDLGDLGADDLQAVVWFMEKEKWTKNGWTTKTGEGGSLDFEASLAGAPDADRVSELRSIINTQGHSAEAKALAQQELDSLKTPLERFVLGVSGERPGNVPSNVKQAEIAAEFDDVVRGDASVITYKLTNTIGRFMKTDERALDAEFVVRSDFNPAPLERRLIEQGKALDQDAVFISKVVEPGAKNARPGMEIYFTKGESADFARELSDELAKRGIDGFTFITDARQADRVNVQAVAGGADTGTLTGIRMQYIPEFDDAATPERMIQMEDLFWELHEKYAKKGGVSVANAVHYDTKVIFKGDYDVHLAGTTGSGKGTFGTGQSVGSGATKSNSGAGTGSVSAGAIPNGQRQGARN